MHAAEDQRRSEAAGARRRDFERAFNVKIRRGPWNEDLFRVLEGFPDLAHDDEVAERANHG
jgi:phage terminase large subunit-like protein